MSEIETRLRRYYALQTPPAPNVTALVATARRRGRTIRRRRRASAATGILTALAVALISAEAATAPRAAHVDRSLATPPVPAGPALTVYRFPAGSSETSILSFLDTRGRWCVGEAPGGSVRLTPGAYHCADAGLTPSTTGFGRVATMTDAFDYDGVNRWMQGVATAEVTRVTVVLADGSMRTARVARDDGGIVFSVRVPLLAKPAFYRAYDATGHLVQQRRVPGTLPDDPFADWRQEPSAKAK